LEVLVKTEARISLPKQGYFLFCIKIVLMYFLTHMVCLSSKMIM